jgi:hypothetical protein
MLFADAFYWIVMIHRPPFGPRPVRAFLRLGRSFQGRR